MFTGVFFGHPFWDARVLRQKEFGSLLGLASVLSAENLSFVLRVIEDRKRTRVRKK